MDREEAENLARMIAQRLVDHQVIPQNKYCEVQVLTNKVLYEELVKPEEEACYRIDEKKRNK